MRISIVFWIAIFLYVTDSNGQWDILNEGGDFQSIDFVNENVGWIIGENDLHKTVDGGDTWQKITLDENINIFKADFINELIGWGISEEEFIYKTLDGGSSWFIQEIFNDYVMFDLQIVTDSCVYISAHTYHPIEHSILLKTVDGGNHWTEITRNETNRKYQLIWFQDIENGIFVGTEYNGSNPYKCIILRTDDGGSTWSEQQTMQFDILNIIRPINDSTAFFKTTYDNWTHSIFKTTDTLKTWSMVYQLPIANVNNIHSLYCLDETRLFAIMKEYGSVYFIKSTDGGLNWSPKNQLLFDWGHFRESDIYFRNAEDGFIAGDGFILQTFNGGDRWNAQKLNCTVKDVCFIDKNIGVICGGNWYGTLPVSSTYGYMFVSEDGGQNWQGVQTPPKHYIFNCVFIDSLIGIALSVNGWGTHFLWRTSDRGVNWIEENTIPKPDSSIYSCCFINDLVFKDATNGWMTGSYRIVEDSLAGAFILNTSDGGQIWKFLKKFPGIQDLRSIHAVDDKVCAVGEEGLIITSVNPDSFKIISDVTDLPLNKVFFYDNQHGWISGGYYDKSDFQSILLRTRDGGQSWKNNYRFDKYLVNDLFFADSLHGWVVGSDTTDYGCGRGGCGGGHGVILYTQNGGDTWIAQVEGLSAPLNAIHFKDGYGWAVGENGIVLKSDVATDIWIDQNNNEIYPTKYTLSQNYPNPFNPTTTIEFQIPNSQFTTLKVYNLLGEEVATLINRKLKQGKYTCTFDGRHLASGLYFYQLVAGDYKEVKKMLLVK